MSENELNGLFVFYNTLLEQEKSLNINRWNLSSKICSEEDYLNSVKNNFMFGKRKIKKQIEKLKSEFEKIEKQIEDNKKQQENQEKRINQAIIDIDKYNASEEEKKSFIKNCINHNMYDSCSFTIMDNLVRYISEDEIFELKQKLKYLNRRGKVENYDMFLELLCKYSKQIDDEFLLDDSYNSKQANIMFNENTIKNIVDKYINLFKLKSNIDIYYKDCLESYNDIIDVIKTKIDEEPKKYLEHYIVSTLDDNYNFWMKDYFDIVFMIIDEVRKNENVGFSDIDRISMGGFSSVYNVGNKVIKIGTRMNYTFTDNPYIVKPLLRRSFGGIVVEVTEKVDTNIHVDENQLYEMYSNLRDMGLIWTDIKSANIGRLLKDNKYYWNSELSDSSKARELNEKVGEVELKKGDLVLLDADWIFTEGSNIKVPPFSQAEQLYYKFKDRYDNEHMKLNEEQETIKNIEESEYEESSTRRFM